MRDGRMFAAPSPKLQSEKLSHREAGASNQRSETGAFGVGSFPVSKNGNPDSIASTLRGLHSSELSRRMLQLQLQFGNRFVQRVAERAFPVPKPSEVEVSRLEESPIEENAEQSSEKSEEPRPTQATPELVRNALSSSVGERLPDSLQADLSRKFDHDLSQVTLHRDGEAARAVRSLGANAFARGRKIFLRDGAPATNSSDGQALLVHELAHVVQQTRGAAAPVFRPMDSEEYADRASRGHIQGNTTLDAGPPAPISIAADNGVSYEDDDAKVSVLSTEGEAADRSIDYKQEADAQRAATGVTDMATGKLDEKALAIENAVKAKEKSKPKLKKNAPKPASAALNSSPDLRNASAAEIQDQSRALAKAQMLSPDKNEQELLGRELENTQQAAETRAAADAAEQKAKASSLKQGIAQIRGQTKALEEGVVSSNELRNSTSSIVTGPTHLYGGSWNQMEPADFADTNILLTQATEALNEGNFAYAEVLLEEGGEQYSDLNKQFSGYQEGIQRGGERVIRGLEATKVVGQASAMVADIIAPELQLGRWYNTAQNVAEIASKGAYGIHVDPMELVGAAVGTGAAIHGAMPGEGPQVGGAQGGGAQEPTTAAPVNEAAPSEAPGAPSGVGPTEAPSSPTVQSNSPGGVAPAVAANGGVSGAPPSSAATPALRGMDIKTLGTPTGDVGALSDAEIETFGDAIEGNARSSTFVEMPGQNPKTGAGLQNIIEEIKSGPNPRNPAIQPPPYAENGVAQPPKPYGISFNLNHYVGDVARPRIADGLDVPIEGAIGGEYGPDIYPDSVIPPNVATTAQHPPATSLTTAAGNPVINEGGVNELGTSNAEVRYHSEELAWTNPANPNSGGPTLGPRYPGQGPGVQINTPKDRFGWLGDRTIDVAGGEGRYLSPDGSWKTIGQMTQPEIAAAHWPVDR
jgi:hypothetical protein